MTIRTADWASSFLKVPGRAALQRLRRTCRCAKFGRYSRWCDLRIRRGINDWSRHAWLNDRWSWKLRWENCWLWTVWPFGSFWTPKNGHMGAGREGAMRIWTTMRVGPTTRTTVRAGAAMRTLLATALRTIAKVEART